MSAAIEPGMWVECVANRHAESYLQIGGLYCVEETHAFNTACAACNHYGIACAFAGLTLKGVRPREGRPSRSNAICATYFKPVYRQDDALIQSLLEPAPAEPEVVSA